MNTFLSECLNSPCHHGSCSNTVGSYSCSCIQDFTGKNCQIEIDECSSNPCQNGGSCIDRYNDYICLCLEGDTGKNCQIDIPKIVVGPQMFTGNTGESRNFTCHVTGHPTPNIAWTFTDFANQPLVLPSHSLSQNNETITLTNIQKSGVIVCTSTNEFGTDRVTTNIIAHGSKLFGRRRNKRFSLNSSNK